MDSYILTHAPYLALIPPILAIGLALWKKEVYSSLFFGGLLAALLLFDFHPLRGLRYLFVTMGSVVGDNAMIIIFLCMLGILVALMGKSGGSQAYGNWAEQNIKSRSGVMLATSALGALIFVDDYFNCLTVGTVMRPVTDKMKISRAKLAYIIDATAAPVCIIAPISSWALAVGVVIEQATGEGGGFMQFVNTIPYNLYALVTIAFLIVLSLSQFDFGAMRRFEKHAKQFNDVFVTKSDRMVSDDVFTPSPKGRVFDLIIPIAVLIVTSLLFMFYTGGLFSGAGIVQAMGDCDAYVSMVVGGFVAIVVAMCMYLPRKLMSFQEALKSLPQGIKTMIPAILILTLAWTLVQACKDIQTAAYIADLIAKSNIWLGLLPAIVFVIAAALAFSTGTSWGTFGILLPFVIAITSGTPLYYISMAATLAGAVCGDHMSPISDTTILASTGAECNHLDHVKTQLPYVLTAAAICLVGYIVGGVLAEFVPPWANILIMLVLSFGLIVPALLLAKKVTHRYDLRAAAKATSSPMTPDGTSADADTTATNDASGQASNVSVRDTDTKK